MGTLKRAAEQKDTKGEGPPWFLPSGIYTAPLVKVEIGKSDTGRPCPVYTLTFIPDDERVKTCANGLPPDGALSIPKLKISLDTNDSDDKASLYDIIGRPMRDGNAVVWDPSGYVQWNGKTDDGFRAGGKVEITVETEEPRAKAKGDGYWWAKYAVTDVSRMGEASQVADEAALMLLADLPPGDGLPPAPGAKVHATGKQARR